MGRLSEGLEGAGTDTLISFENLIGSKGDDTLLGNDEDNIIGGGGGTDTIHGRAGDDILSGETGDDFLYGGEGVSSLSGNTTSGNAVNAWGSLTYIKPPTGVTVTHQ